MLKRQTTTSRPPQSTRWDMEGLGGRVPRIYSNVRGGREGSGVREGENDVGRERRELKVCGEREKRRERVRGGGGQREGRTIDVEGTRGDGGDRRARRAGGLGAASPKSMGSDGRRPYVGAYIWL